MVFVCNLQNIHSLANVVILFAIKTCQPCHYINQLLAFTRESAARIKTRVSGLPMITLDRLSRFLTSCLTTSENKNYLFTMESSRSLRMFNLSSHRLQD